MPVRLITGVGSRMKVTRILRVVVIGGEVLVSIHRPGEPPEKV